MVILRPRVFVTRQFFPEALEVLTDAADTEVWPDDEPPTPEQLLGKVVEADGILNNIMDRIDADVFQAAHRLKVDLKSTRLNSSHVVNSYAVFCLKKKN